MHRAHTAGTGPATIFIHNGAPQALVGCYENNRAGRGAPVTMWRHWVRR